MQNNGQKIDWAIRAAEANFAFETAKFDAEKYKTLSKRMTEKSTEANRAAEYAKYEAERIARVIEEKAKIGDFENRKEHAGGWFEYPEYGSFFKAQSENDLYQYPMNADDSIPSLEEMEENCCEVDWCCIEEIHKAECREVLEEILDCSYWVVDGFEMSLREVFQNHAPNDFWSWIKGDVAAGCPFQSKPQSR